MANKASNDQSAQGNRSKFIIIAVICVVSILGLYGLYSSRSARNTTNSKVVTNNRYLEIKEEGIKFQLPDAIQDAYYTVGANGQIAFGLRSLDEKEEFVDCKPHNSAAAGKPENLVGVAVLSMDKYTPERKKTNNPEDSGFKLLPNAVRIGDNYYFIQTDYDCQSQDANSQNVIKKAQEAFRDTSKTIIKL